MCTAVRTLKKGPIDSPYPTTLVCLMIQQTNTHILQGIRYVALAKLEAPNLNQKCIGLPIRSVDKMVEFARAANLDHAAAIQYIIGELVVAADHRKTETMSRWRIQEGNKNWASWIEG